MISIVDIEKAKKPEDLFPDDETEAAKIHKDVVKTIHPDLHPDDRKKYEALMQKINALWAAWEKKISKEIDLALSKDCVLKSVKQTGTSGIYAIYSGKLNDTDMVVKTVISPKDNDLAENEAKSLGIFKKAANFSSCDKFIPTLHTGANVKTGSIVRKTIVTNTLLTPNHYSLEQIIAKYPNGIPSTAFAWMYSRVLEALSFAHENDVLNGSITPDNIWFGIKDHSCVIPHWHASIGPKDTIKYMSTKYKDVYPYEVESKLFATPSTDVYMLTKSMLLATKLTDLPAQLNGLMQWACLSIQSRRPEDTFDFYREYRKALKEAFGEPKFVEFSM